MKIFSASHASATLSGDDVLSLEAGSAAEAAAIAAGLRETGFWLEAVSGIDSVAVRFDAAVLDPDTALEALERQLDRIEPEDQTADAIVEIPVVYGGAAGPDLDDVLADLGIGRSEFIERHTGREHRVDMLGFTPGFAYLGDPDPSLDVPRREEPRVHVPAGSIGIAGGRTGIYSLPGPGGWRLVGRTTLELFDGTAAEPFRLRPGLRVRFLASDGEGG